MKSFVAALLLLTSVPTLLSVILTWKTKDANIFKIPWTAISMSKRYHVLPKENYNKSYAQQFTLDERCARGLPVSIAWHKYDPYTGINPLPHPKTRKNYGLGITGIIPAILNDMIQYCCPAGSEVQYGMFLANVREAENQRVSGCYDFTFPLGARHAHQSTFGDRVFVPLVRAPRVVLLAHDNHKRSTKTYKLVTTIMDAWPMFIFILVSASLSGFMIWFLDHYNNTSEFSSSAVRGPWEGFWFSLVTMTTVGYGDRNPKSVLARIFCTMWIIMGLVVTSSFIAMITTSLSARTVMHFPIHGSLIGAVNGSEEYRLGVSKNAEMRVFKNVYIMSQALIKHEIDGALVDNFVITKVREQLKDQPVRIEKFIEHPVTYGVALGQNSSKIARCLRHFKTSYARKVWEAIRINLQPVMVKDTANEGLKVVEGMFYEENSFKLIVFGGLAILGCLLLLGILYEIYMRRTLITRVKKTEQLKQDKKSLQLKEIQKKCNHSTHSCSREAELLATYLQFHKEWISKFPSPRERQALFYSEYSSATPLVT